MFYGILRWSLECVSTFSLCKVVASKSNSTQYHHLLYDEVFTWVIRALYNFPMAYRNPARKRKSMILLWLGGIGVVGAFPSRTKTPLPCTLVVLCTSPQSPTAGKLLDIWDAQDFGQVS